MSIRRRDGPPAVRRQRHATHLYSYGLPGRRGCVPVARSCRRGGSCQPTPRRPEAPSGVTATPHYRTRMASEGGGGTLPVARSQTRRVLSDDVPRRPPGAVRRHRHATAPQPYSPSEGARGTSPVARSQTRRVLSSSTPETASGPCRQASPPRQAPRFAWPSREARDFPVARSQTRRVASDEAETARVPSGVTATPYTGAVCPFRTEAAVPGCFCLVRFSTWADDSDRLPLSGPHRRQGSGDTRRGPLFEEGFAGRPATTHPQPARRSLHPRVSRPLYDAPAPRSGEVWGPQRGRARS